MEEHSVLSDEEVGDSVAFVGNGPEAAAHRAELGVLVDVDVLPSNGRLRSGQPPRFAQHFLQSISIRARLDYVIQPCDIRHMTV